MYPLIYTRMYCMYPVICTRTYWMDDPDGLGSLQEAAFHSWLNGDGVFSSIKLHTVNLRHYPVKFSFFSEQLSYWTLGAEASCQKYVMEPFYKKYLSSFSHSLFLRKKRCHKCFIGFWLRLRQDTALTTSVFTTLFKVQLVFNLIQITAICLSCQIILAYIKIRKHGLFIHDSLIFNPSRTNPGRREKIELNFYFHTSLWCRKRPS